MSTIVLIKESIQNRMPELLAFEIKELYIVDYGMRNEESVAID